MPQPFAYPDGLRSGPAQAAMRRAGVTSRALQMLWIEWFDYAKQSTEDAKATLEKLAAARNPAEVVAIQSAFVQAAAERFLSRSITFAELGTALALELARMQAGAARPG